MNALQRLWNATKKLARPFDAQIVKDEPAITSAVVGAAVNIGAHYGFHLAAGVQSALAAGTLIAVGAFTRQSVVSVLPDVDDHDDMITEPDIGPYPPMSAAQPPDEDPIPEGG